MYVTVTMPIDVYVGLLGRCPLDSREYAILRNAIIQHVQQAVGLRSLLEILCSAEDAKLMLERAERFYPVAASYIAEALNAPSAPPLVPTREYRKNVNGDTWHFCSTCSKWPTDDFVATTQLTTNSVACNECVIRKNHGECDSR